MEAHYGLVWFEIFPNPGVDCLLVIIRRLYFNHLLHLAIVVNRRGLAAVTPGDDIHTIIFQILFGDASVVLGLHHLDLLSAPSGSLVETQGLLSLRLRYLANDAEATALELGFRRWPTVFDFGAFIIH